MASYILSARAKQDLIDIWEYTVEQWGERQADYYNDQLDERFTWLAKNPLLGKDRDEVADGLRCFPQGNHIVFYRIADDEIEIIAIPHQSQDPQRHFDD